MEEDSGTILAGDCAMNVWDFFVEESLVLIIFLQFCTVLYS